MSIVKYPLLDLAGDDYLLCLYMDLTIDIGVDIGYVVYKIYDLTETTAIK